MADILPELTVMKKQQHIRITSRRIALKPMLLLLPAAVLFLLFQLAPMLWVIINSFIYEDAWSFANFSEIFTSPFYIQAFENTLWISAISSVGGLILAALFAASLQHAPARPRRWLIAFTNMTGNFSGVPLAFAFVIILGVNGAVTLQLKAWGVIDDFNLYSATGLMLIYLYFQIPLGILLLYPAFDALKPEWEDAAKTMGAGRFAYWRYVALPVLSPALLGTFIILFANAVGAYASTYALTTGNYNMVTIRIASLVSGDLFLEPNMAAALSVLLMIILGFITATYHWLLKRSYHAKC
ncbi:ABC transporter permease [Morganella psychrotolerans]|uniref:ABC transporter permease n=2 Tax=Morganella psychrotolerans TaxID=368603 RepID=A0A1B8HCE1_9GAMM|nr:ABC transporter permease [Morganella psychrotolerans]